MAGRCSSTISVIPDDSRTHLLGIDTGGTYTDAVIYDETRSEVVAKAKSPTTPDDLSIGVGGAVAAVLKDASVAPADIDMVALSTTLATNALVENRGRTSALVLIGLEPEVLDRGGLAEAIEDDRLIFIGGGHDSSGEELEPLDETALLAALDEVTEHVDAFAVTGQFSVRNPAHELRAMELITERTGKAVTASHTLSVKLNGPRRAVTALLNARLIALTDELLDAAITTLAAAGVTAPLMVVRGDGSLVTDTFAKARPIETILSGPAASIVGAAHLVDAQNAIVSDIGGTTTDIAVLRDGRPEVTAEGAVVGGHATMVQAVAIRTHGLGGDSEVTVAPDADGAELLLGPRRVVPLASIAGAESSAVASMLAAHSAKARPSETDGKLAALTSSGHRLHESQRAAEAELELLGRLAQGARPLSDLAETAVVRKVLDRLVRRGHIRVAGFTPTDACHVIGIQDSLDRTAAEQTADLFARQRDRFGQPVATSGAEVAQIVFDHVVQQSARAVLATLLTEDGYRSSELDSPILAAAFSTGPGRAMLDLSAAVTVPIVGLGAPAHAYYPAVGDALNAEVIVPEHAEVANAIGAVVGRVRQTRSITIDAPRRGSFLVLGGSHPTTFFDLDEAKQLATDLITADLAASMAEAGASEFETKWHWVEQVAEVEGQPYFVRGEMTATGTGRPQLA